MKSNNYNMSCLQALNKNREKVGGSIHSRSSIELPCNMKHSNLQPTRSNSAKLLSRVSAVKDCLIAVTEKCKSTSKGRLVCEIVAAPEPWPLQIGYRLAAYRPGLLLLYPLSRHCYSGEWPYTVRLLCHLYCTSTQWHVQQTGKQCLFHGLLFIHQRKQYESLPVCLRAGLSSAITEESKSLWKRWGTGRFYSAFHSVFPDANCGILLQWNS